MQIVIDIPEEIYMDIKEEVRTKVNTFEHIPFLHEIISVGTQLPKGHGRLIDADKVVAEAKERMKYPANHQYMECVIAHMGLAPTIIEADKEDKNE